jgi:hypothetical protein
MNMRQTEKQIPKGYYFAPAGPTTILRSGHYWRTTGKSGYRRIWADEFGTLHKEAASKYVSILTAGSFKKLPSRKK